MRSRTVLQRPSHELETFRPTKIATVEITQELRDLTGLTRYENAAVLVRYHGTPLGCVLIPCRGDVIEASRLQHAIASDGEIRRMLVPASLKRYLGAPESVSAPSVTWSVVVCTRDRVHHLTQCLDALTRMRSSRAQGSIIVVDNDPPTSATRDLVAKYPDVRYLVEPRRGLNAARAAGLAAADGDIVVFTDDDVIVDANWIEAMLEPFSHPRVGAVTGLTMPYELETPAQAIFEYLGGHSRGYRRQVFDLSTMPAARAAKVGTGANMAFRRSVAVALGLFEPELDMGTVTRTGGDSHAFYLVIRHGYQIVYTPEALVWHVHRREYHGLKDRLYAYSLGGMAHLTRCLVRYHDPEVFAAAGWWLWQEHLAPLYRSLRDRPDALPASLALAQLAGFVQGPGAYFQVKRIEDARPPARYGDLPIAAPVPERTGDETSRLPDPAGAVVILSDNRCAMLQRVLEALGAQTVDMRQVDVIVVLDGSTDGSAAMLAEWVEQSRLPRLKWVAQDRAGRAAARARGVRETTAAVLIFIDDDVVPEPHLVAAHLKHHRGDPVVVLGNARIVCSRSDDLYQTITWARWEDAIDERGRAGRPSSYRDFWAGNVSLRREDFLCVGGFDPEFKGDDGEDHEIGYRLLKAGTAFVVEPAANAHRHHRSSLQQILHDARQQGRNDVLLGRKHPELLCGLGISGPGRHAEFVFRRPRLCVVGAWVARSLTVVSAAWGFAQFARRWLGRLQQHAYWWGVRDALRTWEAFREYRARQPPPAIFTWDLHDPASMDLASIPADRASVIVVRSRARMVGTLKLVPPIVTPLPDRVAEEMTRQIGWALYEAVASNDAPWLGLGGDSAPRSRPARPRGPGASRPRAG